MIGKITKSESEKVVGEDANHIPIVECPEVKPMPVVSGKRMIGMQWYKCAECGNECLHEVNGLTYYHKLRCSHSNGIGYGEERSMVKSGSGKSSGDYTGVSKRSLGSMMYELTNGSWTSVAPC